jgi:hypothetical protein
VQVTRMMGAAALAASVAIGGSACSKAKKSDAPSETQVAGDVRTPDVPMTVAGCLRAGNLADTFVLMQDASNTGAQATANYQLVGVDGVDLRQHIGERVQVTGVLASQQEVASRSTPAPAQQKDDKPTGTTGKPTVQTETQVDIRTLQVKSVNPQGGKCNMK